MSYELSELKFNVNTEKLAEAVKMVKDLAAAVKGLEKPLEGMGTAASAAGAAVEKGTEKSAQAAKAQTKQVGEMSQAVRLFYKEQGRLAKEDQKRKDQMFEAGDSMNNEAVKAYGKYMENQYQVQKKATDASIKEMGRETKALQDKVKTQQSILEQQQSEARHMARGASRGEATVLARAEARGQGADIPDIISTQQTKRSFSGGDSFDKTISGLRQIEQERGQAREGYRQMIAYQKEFNKLQLEGNGKETSLIALNRKETDNLYRDKLRLLEVYKQTKNASLDFNDPDFVTKVKAQANAMSDLKTSLRGAEEGYKQVVQQKRPLENIRTVDSTKRRNELNYMARATSVQLGDIGVSLAGGQNPLTVFLQQGDQLRAILGGVGKDTQAMQQVMSGAFTQIITGFVTVGQAMTALVGGAFKATGDAIVGFTMKWTGFNAGLDLVRLGFEKLDYNLGTNFVKKFDAMGSSMGGLGTIIRGLAAVIAGTLVVGLLGLAFAYKEIIQVSQDLSVALATSGGALNINKKEALAMSAALASTSGTSMQVAGVITEIAKAGNLGQESIVGITKASLDLEKYGGIAVKDTVAQYSKLADDPVKALAELALKTGDVTVGTLEHIDSLVKQGNGVQAVTEAIAEMNRVNALAAQKMKDDMSPLEKLWSDMKGQLTLLKDEFYSVAKSEGSIDILTLAWRGLASAIAVAYAGAKMFGVLANPFKGSDEARKEGLVVLKDLQETGRGIFNMPTAKKKDTGTEEAIKVEKQYTNVMQGGFIVRKELYGAEAENQRKSVQDFIAVNKDKEKYMTVANMSTVERTKKKNEELARVDKNFKERAKAQGVDLVELEQNKQAVFAAIEEQFKPKKEAKAKKSDEQKEMEAAKKFMDDMLDKSSGKLTTYTEDIAKLNKAKASGAYTEEQAAKAMAAYMAKQPEAIELARKQKEITKQNQDAFTDLIKEILDAEKAISKLNKSYADKASDGGFNNEERAKEIAFQEKLLGLGEQQKREMTLVFEEESRIRKINRQEIKDLETAQLAYNEAVLKSPTSRAKADVDLQSAQKGISSVAEGERENVRAATNVEVRRIQLEITGLDKISETFSGLGAIVGNFGSMAQTNVDNITASIGRMGDSYKGQFSGMLKDAQASAAGYGRLQKSIGGISSSIKTLSDADKKYAAGSREHTQAQVGGYAEMAGAAAEYFEKGSTGYDVLKAAEQGFRAFELAMSVQAMAQKWVAAAASNAADASTIPVKLASGAAGFFATMGPFAFPAIAAMLAVMASFGFSGGGSSGSFGTLGAGNSIGSDGRSSKAGAGEDMNAGTNYDTATGAYTKQNKPQKTEQEMTDFANAAAIDAAANAVSNLKVEAMKLTKGSEELEKSLMRARLAASGAGIAQHELATQGMNEAELASYNYNQALKAQLSAQMDIANGTEFTSENMEKLAGESRSLAIELAMASGDIAGARAMQRQDDTAGYTSAEVAVYDHNTSMRANIEAMNAGASAAREAEQAEQDLANKRYELSGRLNVLLGRQTQLAFDRATELAGTTDEASLAMLGLIYQMEDLNSSVDAAYAVMERSFAYTEKAIAAERKIAEMRLKGATDLQSLLKGAVDATTPETARVVAQAQLKGFLALARSSGALPDAEFLKPTLTALTRSSIDSFKSDVAYRRDQALTANDITELAGFANTQVTLEQQSIDRLDAQLEVAKLQIELAKAQLDALRGVDTSVKDLGLALAGFQGAVSNLTSAQSSAGSYSYAAPSPSSGGGGGGGYGGGASSSPSAEYESIAGQDNKDIVAGYRTYYNRNPDPSGYQGFVESRLSGDKLMQSILGASAANPDGQDYKTALSKGYDPTNPTIKFLKSLQASAAVQFEDFGSFAVGSNYIPNDMLAQIHKGERILPAADNAELFSRLNNPERNAEVLAAAVERLTREVEGLRIEQRQTASNTKATEKLLSRLSNDGESLNVTVAT